jgi:hypothetical protein
MRKKIKSLFVALLGLGLCLSLAVAQTPILPLDQIKAGQKGKGRTVFEEDKIEEFDVEVLGVLYNIQPKKNVILARLRGKNLETTGVIAGMSGSPVYIDGKMVGAVAFSFPYAKEAIAGITPIGEMLAISEDKAKSTQFSSARTAFTSSLVLDDLFEIYKDVLASRQNFFAAGQSCAPLRIPLLFGGFSSRILDKAKSFFSRLGFYPVNAGGGGQSLDKPTLANTSLREGDPVSLQLVSGDLDVSAVGTVTYVDGNKILAFGHPLYNLGSVEYAMAKAKIITVVPALDTSFKMAATGNLVGTFTQDRSSGALGELGKMPRLVPLNVKMTGAGTGGKEFKLKVVNDKLLTPLLVNLSLSALLGSEDRSAGDLSLELEGDVFLDNGQSVHLEDMYSGNFDASIQNLSGLLTAVVYFLTSNEFKDVGVHRIDLTVKSTEQLKLAYLEKVWLDKYEASPGESISLRVFFRTFRGESLVEDVAIQTPNLPAGSEFQLIVGDAASMHQVEMGQYRSQDFVPRSLNQLVRLLNNLRKNNRIYFKIIAFKPGLFLKGEEMPNLPPAMKSMFASPRASASSPTELAASTLSEYQLAISYMFKGLAVIPIKIRK